MGGAAAAEGDAGEEVEWKRRCAGGRRHGSGRAWSGEVRLRVGSEHAVRCWSSVWFPKRSRAFNTWVSKCGTVAKGIAVRDQDVGMCNSSRRLAIISALHCSVEGVASAADL